MIHRLTPKLHDILERWSHLGFTTRHEALDFILANTDWDKLVKDILDPADVKEVNEWRVRNIAAPTKL
jgi:hypothetical protein